ncbi:MAG: hypothetical protein AB1728_12210 [Bacteroidota bacterium]
MRSKLLPLLLLVFLFLGVDCKDEPPVKPPVVPPPTVELAVADTGVTEMWLTLKFTDANAPRGFAVLRNNVQVLSGLLAGSDTLLIDTTAQPKQTYTYKAFRLDGAIRKDSSTAIQATTLDTTSHNFTFEIDTLGDGASSILYDVAIINDTLVYAVGEIYLKDSTGQIDPILYNMVKWNGKKWSIERVKVNFRNNLITPAIEGIFAFSPTDIWLIGSLPIHGDGKNWEMFDLRSMAGLENISLSKAWGVNSSSMYFVGRGGSIVRHTTDTWQKVESGTSLPINDIWGSYNKQTGAYEVLCVASNQANNGGKKLLRIEGTNVTVLPDSGLSWALSTMWFAPNKIHIVAGDGIYISKNLPVLWQRNISFPPYYKTSVRGNDVNDIVVVGVNGLFSHFNGITWQHQFVLPNGGLGRCAIRGNMISAVGETNNRTIILLGKR